mmetsp:Transcript_39366/g.86553  ORF Transcript_39366/g.86553 Transcript_39366/m.86553 type:complete len:289 (+) Transcript_39366:374-1240(+)
MCRSQINWHRAARSSQYGNGDRKGRLTERNNRVPTRCLEARRVASEGLRLHPIEEHEHAVAKRHLLDEVDGAPEQEADGAGLGKEALAAELDLRERLSAAHVREFAQIHKREGWRLGRATQLHGLQRVAIVRVDWPRVVGCEVVLPIEQTRDEGALLCGDLRGLWQRLFGVGDEGGVAHGDHRAERRAHHAQPRVHRDLALLEARRLFGGGCRLWSQLLDDRLGDRAWPRATSPHAEAARQLLVLLSLALDRGVRCGDGGDARVDFDVDAPLLERLLSGRLEQIVKAG